MQSKTWIAIGALAVLGILAFVTLRAPEKGEKVGPRERPIAAFKAADAKELQISSNGGKDAVTLKLEGTTWKLTAPTPYAADASLVKTAIDQLEKIGFADIVTEKKDKHADLEVSEDKGAHVVAKDGAGKALFDAWIGKSASGFTMVRPQGKDVVWQATGLFKYTYAKEAKQWRDHAVLAFNKDDATRLTVEAAGQKLALEKVPSAQPAAEKDKPAPPQEARWKVIESTVKVDPMDDSVANQMVLTLSSLQAADFDDAAKPADAGIEAPRFKLTVTTNKGENLTLLVGNAKGEDNWVGVAGKPQIWLLHKYSLDRLTQKPIDFRDKTIVKAKEDDLVGLDITVGAEKVSLTHEGTAWKQGATKGPKLDLDDSKVKGVVGGFEDLKGTAFADAGVDTGLAKPAGEVILHLRDKSTVTLKIGGATKDGQDYYVMKVGSPDVLQVRKFQIDRFWRKPGDLTKTAPAAPAAK